MKINIVNLNKNLKNGYLNICEKVSLSTKDYQTFNIIECSYESFDVDEGGGKALSFGEAEEIVADFILQTYEHNQILNLLGKWSLYLGQGGLLTISYPDIYRISIDLANRKLSVKEFDSIVRLKDSKCSIDPKLILSYLSTLGFKVRKHKIEEYTNTIVAEKL